MNNFEEIGRLGEIPCEISRFLNCRKDFIQPNRLLICEVRNYDILMKQQNHNFNQQRAEEISQAGTK